MEDRDFECMLERVLEKGLPASSETFRDELLERCLSVLDADNEGVCIDDDELDLIAAAGDINAQLDL